jgi:mono/diheme cytochrome c family protein
MLTRRNMHMAIVALPLTWALCSSDAARGDTLVPLDTTAEAKVYAKYGCKACHGDNGVGTCDLRDANHSFGDDVSLRHFIDQPARTRPGSKMPAYGGVIDDADYAALLRHIRALSTNK